MTTLTAKDGTKIYYKDWGTGHPLYSATAGRCRLMKEPTKTYGETALFLERPADDGWPEDAGWWPLGGCMSPKARCSAERLEGIEWFSPPQFIKSLLGRAAY